MKEQVLLPETTHSESPFSRRSFLWTPINTTSSEQSKHNGMRLHEAHDLTLNCLPSSEIEQLYEKSGKCKGSEYYLKI